MSKEIEYIDFCLLEAEEYGLLAEVVSFALLAIKDDPTISITHAIDIGIDEWIK